MPRRRFVPEGTRSHEVSPRQFGWRGDLAAASNHTLQHPEVEQSPRSFGWRGDLNAAVSNHTLQHHEVKQSPRSVGWRGDQNATARNHSLRHQAEAAASTHALQRRNNAATRNQTVQQQNTTAARNRTLQQGRGQGTRNPPSGGNRVQRRPQSSPQNKMGGSSKVVSRPFLLITLYPGHADSSLVYQKTGTRQSSTSISHSCGSRW